MTEIINSWVDATKTLPGSAWVQIAKTCQAGQRTLHARDFVYGSYFDGDFRVPDHTDHPAYADVPSDCIHHDTVRGERVIVVYTVDDSDVTRVGASRYNGNAWEVPTGTDDLQSHYSPIFVVTGNGKPKVPGWGRVIRIWRWSIFPFITEE